MSGAGRDLRGLLGRALVPALALITAFVVGAFLIVLTDIDHLSQIGTDPLGAVGGAIDVVVRGYVAMFTGSIGDPGRILAAMQSGNERDLARAIRPATEALLIATPLIFLTLGVGVALHARLFNFGADGQFLLGAVGAALGANALAGQLPPGLILAGAALVGTLFGAAWGFLPGLLRARTGAHEIITTLMLNTIAFQLTLWVVSNVAMRPLPSIATVPRLLDIATIRLDWGFVVALVVAAGISVLVYRTTLGFELRAVGFSGPAARAAGIRPGRATVLALSLSGGLAGLGGALLTLGAAGGIEGSRSGFVALALALLAGLFWAGYILASARVGRLLPGVDGLAVALVLAAVLALPVGAEGAVRGLDDPGVLLVGLSVALLSSVIPYGLELTALRRMPTRVFGVLMSLEPAAAAVAGLVVLGQRLGTPEVLALVLVSVASLGVTLGRREAPRPPLE